MINFVIGMLVRDVFMLEGDVVVSSIICKILYIEVYIYLRMNDYIFIYIWNF